MREVPAGTPVLLAPGMDPPEAAVELPTAGAVVDEVGEAAALDGPGATVERAGFAVRDGATAGDALGDGVGARVPRDVGDGLALGD